MKLSVQMMTGVKRYTNTEDYYEILHHMLHSDRRTCVCRNGAGLLSSEAIA